MAHTIVLHQSGNDETRTYFDFESTEEAIKYVCRMYEQHLKRSLPMMATITYDIVDMFDYIDRTPDLSCLVYKKATNTYLPYDKNWIKQRIYLMLKNEAIRCRN